jgi:hypothetical protein
MTTYKALLAATVPAYRNVEFEAASDVEALEKIKAMLRFEDDDSITLNPEYGEMYEHRLVDLAADDGRFVCEDLTLDAQDTVSSNTLDDEIERMSNNESNSEE